jgi:hypothetical protein
MDSGYRSSVDVPYHNNRHGADVMQAVHIMLGHPSLEGLFSDVEVYTSDMLFGLMAEVLLELYQ